jgi:hypothetical protein
MMVDAGGGERSGAEIRGVAAVRDFNAARLCAGDGAYDGVGMLRKIGRILCWQILRVFGSARDQNESKGDEQGFYTSGPEHWFPAVNKRLKVEQSVTTVRGERAAGNEVLIAIKNLACSARLYIKHNRAAVKDL